MKKYRVNTYVEKIQKVIVIKVVIWKVSSFLKPLTDKIKFCNLNFSIFILDFIKSCSQPPRNETETPSKVTNWVAELNIQNFVPI